MAPNHSPNHRCHALWILGLSTCSVLTVVLIVSPFLSGDSKYSISYEVMFWWEVGFLAPSILAMTVQIVRCNALKTTRGDDNSLAEDGETSGIENKSPDNRTTSCTLKCIFEGFCLVVCGLGSSVLPGKVISSVISCYDMENSRIYKIKVASLVCFALFSSVETVWLMRFKSIKKLKDFTGCVYFLNAIAIMLVILGNVALCARSVLDTIRASTTRSIASRNESMSQHFFDVTLVFSKCSNNTEVADIGVLIWYRYTYSFPFLFGLLATKLIFSVLFSKDKINNQEPGYDNSDLSSRTNEAQESNPDHTCTCIKDKYCRLACKLIFRAIRCMSKYSYILSIMFAVCMFGLRLVFEILSGSFNTSDGSANTGKYTTALHVIILIYNYIYVSVPSLAYFLLCKKEIKANFDLNKSLLMISAVGNIFFCLFEMVDSVAVLRHLTNETNTYEIFYFGSLLFRIFGVFCKIMFIFYCHGLSKDQTIEKNADTLLLVRGVLIFLAYDNGFRWLAGTIMPEAALKQVHVIKDEDIFGVINWQMVDKLFAPTVLLFRLLSSLMCSDLSKKIRHVDIELDTSGNHIQDIDENERSRLFPN